MIKFFLSCILSNAVTASLNLDEVPIEFKKLFVPPLEEIAKVLNEGLQNYFEEVQVDVVDCPDLTQPPFTLANSGLGGNPRLVSVGGLQNAFPYANLSKVYDVRHILQKMDLSTAFVFGAASGPYLYAGDNCNDLLNINIADDNINQQSRIVIIKEDGFYEMQKLPKNETRFDILNDIFVSEGKPGPVLKIHARKRIGKYSFSVSIRKALAKHYGNDIVGLGGTFAIKEGIVSHSLLPPFSKTPHYTFDDFLKWSKIFNMSAPLVAVGTLITGTYDLDLRLQHFHTFSDHGEGGHYNNDVTPDIAHYLGYFNTAEYVYRIDKPPLPIKTNEDQ